MSESNAAIAEQALSIVAAVAGCSAPPFGAVVVGGALTAGALVRYFFPEKPSSSTSTLQQIVGAVSQQFALKEITDAVNRITAVQKRFIDHTSGPAATTPLPKDKDINRTLRLDPTGRFSNLYNFLNDEVAKEGLLFSAIQDMTSTVQGDISRSASNLQAAYLPTFAFGVSTYLLLATYWVSLATAVKPDAVKDMSIDVAANYLADKIAYFKEALQAYERAVDTRLALVNNAPAPGCVPYTYHVAFVECSAVYFSDHGTTVDNFDPYKLHVVQLLDNDEFPQQTAYFPGDLGRIDEADGATNVVFALRGDVNLNACNIARTQYIDEMRKTLYSNYFDPAKLRAAAAQWQESLSRLRSVLPR